MTTYMGRNATTAFGESGRKFLIAVTLRRRVENSNGVTSGNEIANYRSIYSHLVVTVEYERAVEAYSDLVSMYGYTIILIKEKMRYLKILRTTMMSINLYVIGVFG